MHVKQLFVSSSKELQAKFERTTQILHNKGKGDAREEAFKETLEKYLPCRYSLGRGQVIASNGSVSREQDLVIFDRQTSPRLSVSDSHDLFPLETVFGSIQVKSALSSTELRDAYENIASLKRLRRGGTFEYHANAAMAMGMARPMPLGVVVAYAADRSLDAIAKQAGQLDNDLGGDVFLAPELIAVLGEGIIGYSGRFRGQWNEFHLPSRGVLRTVRRNKHHTLLRLYMQIEAEIDSMVLEPLRLHDYIEPVEVIDGHRINYRRRLMFKDAVTGEGGPKRLNKDAIRRVLAFLAASTPVTMREQYLMQYGNADISQLPPDLLTRPVYVYNPRNSPPLTAEQLRALSRGEKPQGDYFSPLTIEVDGQECAIDIGAFEKSDFEEDPDADWDDFYP